MKEKAISNVLTYIGLDIGERRIGVARVNSMAKISEALDHINVKDLETTFTEIKEIVREHDAVGVVIGLPRGLNGQETQQTKTTLDFAIKLTDTLDIEVYMIDEAGTSKAADSIIGKNKLLSRDSVAAGIIAEDFINYTNKSDLKV